LLSEAIGRGFDLVILRHHSYSIQLTGLCNVWRFFPALLVRAVINFYYVNAFQLSIGSKMFELKKLTVKSNYLLLFLLVRPPHLRCIIRSINYSHYVTFIGLKSIIYEQILSASYICTNYVYVILIQNNSNSHFVFSEILT